MSLQVYNYGLFYQKESTKLINQSIDSTFIRNLYGTELLKRNPKYKSKNGIKVSAADDINGVPVSLAIAEESDIDSGTHYVNCHLKKFDNVNINLCDTAGLYDGTKDTEQTVELINIAADRYYFHILIVCIDLRDTRIREDDIKLLKRIKNPDKLIVIFTFANKIKNVENMFKIKKKQIIDKLETGNSEIAGKCDKLVTIY